MLVDQPLSAVLAASLKLVFAYPLWSLGVLIAAAVPVAFNLLLPQGFYLIFTASACVLIVNLGTWRVMRRHLPATTLVAH